MKTLFYLLLSVILISGSCVPKQEQKVTLPVVEQAAIRETTFKVEGMTCDHCEMSVCKGVGELSGIVSVSADHEDSTAHIVFDPSKTGGEEIIAAIEKRGYKVVRDQKK